MERKVPQLKAISVKQPFSSLICFGEKKIEVRSWPTSYRGRLLICASKMPYSGAMLAPDALRSKISDAREYLNYFKTMFPLGVMVGMVDLVDCRKMVREDSKHALIDYIPGAYSWVLENPIEVQPEPIIGKLSFFEVPANMVRIKSGF